MDKQWGIRNCFEVGQSILVREGTRWLTRTIEKITVWRGSQESSPQCPHCGIPLLGEPRFWVKGYGNIPITEVMAKEDIDPGKIEGVIAMPTVPIVPEQPWEEWPDYPYDGTPFGKSDGYEYRIILGRLQRRKVIMRPTRGIK